MLITRKESLSLSKTLVALAAIIALASADASATTLVWSSSGSGSFIGPAAWTYDNSGAVATTDNPFTHVGVIGGLGGENRVFVGNGGTATLSTNNQGPFSDNSLFEVRVGTTTSEANFTSIGGPNLQGDGTLNINNVDLFLFNNGSVDDQGSPSTGRLIVGGGTGITGTVNWNSTGTLRTHGYIRVGQNGTGIFNANGGTIRTNYIAGDAAMRVGGGGGTGTFNFNDGVMEVGAADDGTGIPVQSLLQVGQGGSSMGTFNLGDGIGAAGSAALDTWGTVSVGQDGGTGVLNLNADGVLRVNYPAVGGASAQLRLGQSGGNAHGTINLNGGVLAVDGLLEMGFNTGTGVFNVNGSTGSINVRALTARDPSSFLFDIDAGGVTPITVDGNTGSGDVASGNSITLVNPSLAITGLSNYNSLSPITLFEQVDGTASLTGTFGNFFQGQSVGLNGGSQQFYLNYFGGDGNDIVIQSTLPSSSIDGLVWNVGSANFDAGWAEGDGNFGAVPPGSGVNPFVGSQNLYLGKGGVATYDSSTNDSSGSTVKNLYVGTNRASAVVSGTNGNGTLNVNDAESLTVDDALGAADQGHLFVGDAGFTGTVNWNSSGTLDVQGFFRVGSSGGTGTFNQNGGVVQGGTTGGAGKFLAIGENSGSVGTYNLNDGQLLPDGLGQGPVPRLFRVGFDGGTGTLNVGDGIGAADSAVFQSEDDLQIGDGGNGTLNIASDALIETKSNLGAILIGRGGGNGLAVQTGGTVRSDGFVSIGEGNGSVGEYQLSGGVLVGAADGDDAFRVGGGGGNGTFRVSGTGDFSTVANLVIAQSNNSGSVGFLELTGSQASFKVGRLENHNGNDETIRWVADANGVTPILVQGGSGTNRVQLQSSNDVNGNTGTNGLGDLMGNGTALSLDLSALTTSQTLTLIDNRTTGQAILGFFEDGQTGKLYEEGSSILGTGFLGSVTISYVGSAPSGSAGNDVVLNLVSSAVNDADFDSDGDVDGADFLTWQRNVGTNSGATLATGDANGNGAVNGDDLTVWKNQFGTPSAIASAPVPEPASLALVVAAAGVIGLAARGRRTLHGA